ncbi:MAG: FAD:protein FMN transferase [Clostridia bacterium]|nr:FAD:protein FMN transferase [Clostridia bacterium]
MKKTVFFFIAAAISIVLIGCTADTADYYESQMYSMDTVMTISANGSDSESAIKECEKEISRLDSLLSVTGEGDIKRINDNAGKFVQVSEETISLIRSAQVISERTDGAFDITSGVLSELWGFRDKNYRVPSDEEISAALQLVDYRKIEIDGDRVRVPSGMSVDLGAIGKGYASQRTHDIFSRSDVYSAMVSLGGNVQPFGSKPDGSDWRIGIRHPDNDNACIAVVGISDKAVVTSGGYQRYFENGGKIYHHIFDANTGRPAESGILSATVICPDGLTADALSTALYVIGADKAVGYYEKYGGFDMILVCGGGKVIVTSGITDRVELQDDNYEIVTVNQK